MNARGLAVFVLAGGAVVAALFPAGLEHRVRHAWRVRGCADRLRTLHQLGEIRSSMYGRRRTPQFAGRAHWLAVQNGPVPLVGPSDLDLFFCPFQASPIGAGATDFRGPKDRGGPRGEALPIGADVESNHPPCCPLNVVLTDGAVRPCPHDDPWKLQLRSLLSP